MKIVIVGGTGLIGTKVADRLRNQGHDVLQASPSTGVNSLTGEGLAAALAGARVVVDVTNAPSFDPKDVFSFFEISTANLLKAERAIGIRHHVALSIVGIERSPDNAYFQAKLAQEALIRKSGIPYTIMRSTQFLEFLGGFADSATVNGTVRVPRGAFQPIAADEVAGFLAEAIIGVAENQTIEIAGPERKPMSDYMASYLKAVRDPRIVEADAQARYFGSLVDDKSLVPLGSAKLGMLNLQDWLARRPVAAA